MNLEHIKRLRDFLSKLPSSAFDHGSWSDEFARYDDGETVDLGQGKHSCGTTACIAGWCAISENLIEWHINEKGIIDLDENEYLCNERAKDWLELNPTEQAILFYPFEIDDTYSNVYLTPEQWEEHRKLWVDGYLYADTTLAEAVAFLDKVIENETIELSFWKEVKAERVGQAKV